MDVLTAAWLAAGARPAPALTRAGRCARCSTLAELTAVRSAISKTFTGFEGWGDPGGTGLCGACAWAYTTPQLRAEPHLVTRQPVGLRRLQRTDIRAVLLTGALDPCLALVVPLRPGRKHVVPTARWGRVTVDDAVLPWGDSDAARLGELIELRGRGFGSRMLTEPAPSYHVLRRLPPDQWQPTMRAWQQLAPWRAPDSPWLPLALHVTTSTQETPPQ